VTEARSEELQPQIGALLRMAWEQVQDEVYEKLEALGFLDLRPAHRPVMRYPPIDGLRPSQLAARTNLSKQAANDLLRDLEKMGYLRLDPDPTDGRARIIRLTERGWRFQHISAQLSRSVGERWAKAIGQDRFDAFADTLRTIIALGERPRTEGS
jgi:DNA-binding MarR family transcriptional regulator